MPTSADGVLTATWDTERCLVTLVVTGTEWPGPSVPTTVTLERQAGAAGRVLVRGTSRVAAPGGTLVWSDNEAPADSTVTYTVTGFIGNEAVAWSSVTVTTELPPELWGAWVKIPGRPEVTTRVKVAGVQDMSRETLGGYWQIPGGPTISQSGMGALAQSAGMGALSTTLDLTTYAPGELEALHRAIRQAPGQVLLIQTGQPEELPSGYYQVQSVSVSNPTGLRSDLHPMRHVSLALIEAAVPAGPASGWTGTMYADVEVLFPTYADLADADVSYMDLATGEWS